MKSRNAIKKGYTLIELMLVLSIAGILMAASFSGLIYFRNSLQVGNAILALQSKIRDTQDKALTVSVYKSSLNNPLDPNNRDSRFNDKWVYGYTIEPYGTSGGYPNTQNEYAVFAIVDQNNSYPDVNQDAIKKALLFPSTNPTCNGCYCISAPTDGTTQAICVIDSILTFDSNVRISNLSNSTFPICRIWFTSVNGEPTISPADSSSSCYIGLSSSFNVNYSLNFTNMGVGSMKTCQPPSSTYQCP